MIFIDDGDVVRIRLPSLRGAILVPRIRKASMLARITG